MHRGCAKIDCRKSSPGRYIWTSTVADELLYRFQTKCNVESTPILETGTIHEDTALQTVFCMGSEKAVSELCCHGTVSIEHGLREKLKISLRSGIRHRFQRVLLVSVVSNGSR